MLELKVTEKADRDLLSIGRYTEKKWGVRQRRKYLKEISDRFTWLTKNPDRGRNRNDIKPGYYSYLQGRHLIFYTMSDTTVEIIGVLHERMDLTQHL